MCAFDPDVLDVGFALVGEGESTKEHLAVLSAAEYFERDLPLRWKRRIPRRGSDACRRTVPFQYCRDGDDAGESDQPFAHFALCLPPKRILRDCGARNIGCDQLACKSRRHQVNLLTRAKY